MAEECQHGQLARSCEMCELESEVTRLRALVAEYEIAKPDVELTFLLRAEIVKWIAANNAATTIINEQQAEIECLRRMIQR